MAAARTVEVTVEVRFKVSARATEGEIVDAVHAAVITNTLRQPSNLGLGTNARTDLSILSTRVVPVGQPGGSL